MIKKVVRVDDVGRLRRLSCGRGVGEAGKTVGVYAENGGGKTTLVAVFRAARDATSLPLLERQSLPSPSAPAVELLASAGLVRHTAGVWTGVAPPLEVFDRTFVADNVYDGREVGPDQRHGLYRIALGSAEVQAAKNVDEFKRVVTDLQRRGKDVRDRLAGRCASAGVTLASLRSSEDAGATTDALEIETRLAALNGTVDLASLPSAQDVPAPPALNGEGLRAILNETAESMSADAAAAVRAHLRRHLDAQGEAWLQAGVRYAANSDACPYCAQALSGSSFAKLLSTFFDDSYGRLQARVTKAVERLATWDEWATRVGQVERDNARVRSAWLQLVPISDPPDLSSLLTTVAALTRDLRSLVMEKQTRLLDALGSDARVQQVIDAHAAVLAGLGPAQSWAMEVRAQCNRVRRDRGLEVQRLTARLGRIRVAQLRASADVQGDLAELGRNEGEVRSAIGNLDAAKVALEAAEGNRTAAFVETVNGVLRDFGTGYVIEGLKGKGSSARVTADFRIALVGGGSIQVSGKPKDAPRFDTLLSEGDRTTLALAVFIAKCVGAPDPARVVVVDDPITSLDSGRRAMTARYLSTLASTSAQLWVLSHDEFFLRDAMPRDCTYLTIQHHPGRSHLEPWDPHHACKSVYARRLDALEAFVEGNSGSHDDAWRLLRPILEEYLRFRFRKAWGANEWLGDFIGKARAGHAAIVLSPDDVDRIATWCGLASPGMHGNPFDAGPAPSTTEVRNFGRQILRFIAE